MAKMSLDSSRFIIQNNIDGSYARKGRHFFVWEKDINKATAYRTLGGAKSSVYSYLPFKEIDRMWYDAAVERRRAKGLYPLWPGFSPAMRKLREEKLKEKFTIIEVKLVMKLESSV